MQRSLGEKSPITQNQMKDWMYCVLSKEFEIENSRRLAERG